MFIPLAEMDKVCLRQGDILEIVPFPIIDSEFSLLGKIDEEVEVQTVPKLVAVAREHRNSKDCLTAQVKMRLAPGAVLAHCCELELRNGKCLLPAIPIARLIPVKTAIAVDESKLASLRSNKDPRNLADHGYIDYFHVVPHERLSSREWVIDYCQISSIPSTEYGALMKRKVLQMQDRDRVKFKIKLAVFLGSRLTDEEVGLGLENPWAS
jgi:hypothetical protein